MGIGFRAFLIDDNGALCRIPMARYERLTKPDSTECLPEYAGKKLRIVWLGAMRSGSVRKRRRMVGKAKLKQFCGCWASF